VSGDRRAHALPQGWTGLQLRDQLASRRHCKLHTCQLGVGGGQPIPQAAEVALLHRLLGPPAFEGKNLLLGAQKDRSQDLWDVDRISQIDGRLCVDEHRQEMCPIFAA
jgi:hypothetical protein